MTDNYPTHNGSRFFLNGAMLRSDGSVSTLCQERTLLLFEFKGQKLIAELFGVLANDPCRFLSSSTRDTYEQQISLDENAGMRVICDYVSGMRDDYATKLYEKILIPSKGSIFDHL